MSLGVSVHPLVLLVPQGLQFSEADRCTEIPIPGNAFPGTLDNASTERGNLFEGPRGSVGEPEPEEEIEGPCDPEPGEEDEAMGMEPLPPPQLVRAPSVGSTDEDPSRATLQAKLRATPFLDPGVRVWALGDGRNRSKLNLMDYFIRFEQ